MGLLDKFGKRKRKREELEKYMSVLYPKGDLASLQHQIDKEMAKLRKQEEIKRTILCGLKMILFTPLIKIFDVLNMIGKLLLGASAFTFVYGLYLAYEKFFAGNEVDMTRMTVVLVAPFVLSLIVFICTQVSDAMADSLY